MNTPQKNHFMFAAFFFLSLLSTTDYGLRTVYAATDDYANYWAFDEGMGRSVNDARGGQNGVMTGSSTGFGWASGKIGNALGMDGASGLAVALPDSAIAGSQGSISVWFKIEEMTDRNVLLSGTAPSDKYLYALLGIDRDGRPQFQFRTETNGVDRKAQGGKALNRNEWYHLVFTADTQRYRMFINGEELAIYGANIGRWFSDLTNRPFAYRIGASEAHPLIGSFFGYIDDIRVYTRALSAEEAVALYEEGNAGKPTVPGTPPPAPQAPAVPVVEVSLGGAPTVVLTPSKATAPSAAMPPASAKPELTPEKRAEILKQIQELLKRIIELQKELNALRSSGR